LHGEDLADRRECIERCFDADSALNAAASVLARAPTGERVHLAAALARAALVAAQQCAAECAVFEDMDDSAAACVNACHRSDSALRSLLTELSPLAGDPHDRDSST
jgi:ABC-type transporter Mla subunit MlaD